MPIGETLWAVAARWAAEGIDAGPPATPEEIAAWEAAHGVVLPGEVRAYFLRLNGFRAGRDAEMDSLFMNFWRLADVRRLRDEVSAPELEDADGCFVFMDHLLWCSAYAVRLGSVRTGEVLEIDGVRAVSVAPSLDLFLQRYLRRDLPVLLPPVPRRSLARRWMDRVRAWLRLHAWEIRPRLRNQRRVYAALERTLKERVKADPELRRVHRATVTLTMRLDERGMPGMIQVAKPCAHAALNEAALRVATEMRFRPARINLRPVAVLVQIPLSFHPRNARP